MSPLGWSALVALFAYLSPIENGWSDPYQGRVGTAVPPSAKPLPKAACDGDQFNKCTFEVSLDFDRDGRADRARLMNAGGQGFIVVSFGAPKKPPMVVASFRSRFEGHDYIEVVKGRRDTITYVYPEASSAEIRLIAGRSKINWTGD